MSHISVAVRPAKFVPREHRRAKFLSLSARQRQLRNASACFSVTPVRPIIQIAGGVLTVSVPEECPLGHLDIVHLQGTDIKAASVLLSRCFAESDWQGLDDIEVYLKDMIAVSPDAALLVARLTPAEGSGISVPPGRVYRVVGLASISFTNDTRENFSEQGDSSPPKNSAYISNMAVDPSCRRKGIAQAMLGVCERVTLQAQQDLQSMSLHVRIANEGGCALYEAYGYETRAEDSLLRALFARTRHRLMVKSL